MVVDLHVLIIKVHVPGNVKVSVLDNVLLDISAQKILMEISSVFLIVDWSGSENIAIILQE